MVSTVITERRHSGGYVVSEANGSRSRDQGLVAQLEIASPASGPTLTPGTGGSGALPSGTLYAKVTYATPFGESAPSPEASASITGATGKCVVTGLSAPAAPYSASGYNVYAAFASGQEQLQNATPIAFGANYEIDTLGTGIFPPNLNASQIMSAGLVLGLQSVGAASAAAGGSNTGTGTFGALSVLAGAIVGAYALACIQATSGTAAATGEKRDGNVGTGAITINSPAATSATGLGHYQAILTSGTAFDVIGPAGNVLGAGVLGTAFTVNGLNFTIASGGSPAAGDGYDIIVTDNGTALFSVTAPSGAALANLTVGSAYAVDFGGTLSQGGTKFVVGDTFTVTIALPAQVTWAGTAGEVTSGLYYPLNLQATDGTQNAAAILFNEIGTAGGARKCTLHTRELEVNGSELIYPSSATAAQLAAINAQLASLGIIVR